MLFKMEQFNGFGYRVKGINSPYLWSFSNHYSKGKFTRDGFFDPNAVSKQIGAAVLLRRMSERQIAVAGEVDILHRLRK
jgi:lysozyme family protein